MDSKPEVAPESSALLAWVTAAIATTFWGFAALVSIFPLMMSPMMFDAPGSGDNPYAWAIIASMCSFPVLCGVSGLSCLGFAFGAERATREGNEPKRKSRTRAVFVMATLPVLSVIAVVVCFTLLSVMCDGSFDCR